MQDAKEEVRSRLNIEDVIGEYVHLQRAGRNFKGLSPFNSEKTPSFFVSPDKHIWHDFSTNKGGDIFAFVMEVEGVDFREALEMLARKAGVDLSMYDNQNSQKISKLKKRLIQANEMAANYYQASLVKNQHAMEYVFKKRGLNKQIVTDFKIGYAPDSGDALVQFLTKKGFSKNELSQAGLLNRFGTDLFRGRMMVALMDSTGQVIGFTGRIINDDPKAPKYLNTPQTMIYDKGRHVFGLSQAKEAIRSVDYSVVVEGNMDVISSHQVGITSVVATAGTAMTEHHLKALARLSGHVRLAFDGDKAGIAATERAIPIAQEAGIELQIISMPVGSKDPDELIKKDPKLWQQAIDEAIPAVDWAILQYSRREDLSEAAGKRRFTTAALNIVKQLKDSVEQEHYIAKIAKISNSSIDALKMKLDSAEDEPEAEIKKVIHHSENINDPDSYQDILLSIAIIDGATHDLFRSINFNHFSGDHRQAVVRHIIEFGGKPIKETPPELQKFDDYVKILLLKADARYAEWNDQDRYFESARLLRQVVKEHKKKQKDILTEQLRDAESVGDDVKANAIRSELNQLIKEM